MVGVGVGVEVGDGIGTGVGVGGLEAAVLHALLQLSPVPQTRVRSAEELLSARTSHVALEAEVVLAQVLLVEGLRLPVLLRAQPRCDGCRQGSSLLGREVLLRGSRDWDLVRLRLPSGDWR